MSEQVEQILEKPKQRFSPELNAIEEFEGKIPSGIYQGIQERIRNERFPQGVLETIESFPPERQTEALGMVTAARAAFIAAQELAGTVEPARPKADNRQIFSLADEVASAVIQRSLSERFPDYGYLDEEVEGDDDQLREKAKCWIVDPLDGSAGFVRGLNTWAVGIALHETEDVKKGNSGITLGVIASPQYDRTEVVFGGKGTGSFNWKGEAIRVSKTADPKDLSMSVGSRDIRTNKREQEEYISTLQLIGQNTSRLYSGVDTQHAGVWLARGSIDLLTRVVQPSYDVAPVVAVVQGAGGEVMDLKWGETVRFLPLVIQRDKERRHNLLAWNGKKEVKEFFVEMMWRAGDLHRTED
jgi:myo-inositol-1(or 4)-monophosphatase